MVEKDEWKPVKSKVEKILTTPQIGDQKKQKALECQRYYKRGGTVIGITHTI
jgi:hypothetical protein